MCTDNSNNTLECKVCGKSFPKFDQRGFRNAGFTAHQNRCIEKKSALEFPPVHIPVKRRRLLPAPSEDRKNVRVRSDATKSKQDDIKPVETRTLTSTITAYTIQQRGEQQHSLSQQGFSTNDFQPVLHCDYCLPENGVHQASCSILRFVRNSFDGST